MRAKHVSEGGVMQGAYLVLPIRQVLESLQTLKHHVVPSCAFTIALLVLNYAQRKVYASKEDHSHVRSQQTFDRGRITWYLALEKHVRPGDVAGTVCRRLAVSETKETSAY